MAGVFISLTEWDEFVGKAEALAEKKKSLEQEVERVKDKQKYTFKKLKKIIERKDKQINKLMGE